MFYIPRTLTSSVRIVSLAGVSWILTGLVSDIYGYGRSPSININIIHILLKLWCMISYIQIVIVTVQRFNNINRYKLSKFCILLCGCSTRDDWITLITHPFMNNPRTYHQCQDNSNDSLSCWFGKKWHWS
jgi:hypothetical protein